MNNEMTIKGWTLEELKTRILDAEKRGYKVKSQGQAPQDAATFTRVIYWARMVR
jgi:hypothetical protein